jgi:dTDP-4-dehydrorhamnose 3,5-epimerase
MEPIILETKKFFDERGYFSESYRKDTYLEKYNLNIEFVQDNFSVSKKNVIRGLHYQWDKPMHKLVRVTHGEILDVIVDIRIKSSNFGNIYSYSLSEQNGLQLLVPAGFAHGFVVKSEAAHVQYKCSEFYNGIGESGINPLDESLKVDWTIPVQQMIISAKDKLSKSFKEYSLQPKF